MYVNFARFQWQILLQVKLFTNMQHYGWLMNQIKSIYLPERKLKQFEYILKIPVNIFLHNIITDQI